MFEPSLTHVCPFAFLVRFPAYLAACATVSNTTLDLFASVRNPDNATFKLQLPDNWNGPFGQGLDIPATVVTVIAGAILGVGMITVVNTM